MRILMAASAAVALAVSSAAFAASTDTAATPQTPPQQSQATPPHKVAMHHHRDVIGDRETAALNSLEAAGYFSVKDIQPSGRNISVDAKKPGADFVHLTVLPDGTIQTGAAPTT